MPRKPKQRMTLRGYAKARNVSPSYIHKLIVRGIIPRGSDGLIDPDEADRQRARCTIPWRGEFRRILADARKQARARRAAAMEVTICAQCGAKYVPARAMEEFSAAKDANRYCTDWCENDARAGKTSKETLKNIWEKHLDNGGDPKDKKNPDRWLNYWTHYRTADVEDLPEIELPNLPDIDESHLEELEDMLKAGLKEIDV